MVLSPELIERAKSEMQIEQYFQPSDICIPKHELFKQFIEGTKWKGLPKIIFYILMDDIFASAISKAPCGNLGYSLELIKP